MSIQLSIIIVNWNTCQLLDRCLSSLFSELIAEKFLPDNAEIFVIDNASQDGSVAMLKKKYSWINLISNKENLGFARANNQGIKLASGKYILLLNPDTEIYSGAISNLIAFFENHPKAGIVAPQLINSDGSIQASCRAFPSFSALLFELIGLSRLMPAGSKLRSYKMLDWQHNDEREVDQPEGACLLIKKEVFDDIGLLDEGYFMLFEEVDWCYRAKKAGWEIWFTPKAQVLHHLGQAINQVKVRMILSSHTGMYRYWHKHHHIGKGYFDFLVYAALMLLAYLRIAGYLLRKFLSPSNSQSTVS